MKTFFEECKNKLNKPIIIDKFKLKTPEGEEGYDLEDDDDENNIS